MEINLRPIGFVRGGRTEPINDEWDSVTSRIERLDIPKATKTSRLWVSSLNGCIFAQTYLA